PPNFPCPDARIMEFSADRMSIKPGQPVVLSWAAENPGPMTITPGVGAITARGSARVSPMVTTTYTLRVAGGPNGEVLTRTLTIAVDGTTPGTASAVRLQRLSLCVRLTENPISKVSSTALVRVRAPVRRTARRGRPSFRRDRL